MDHSLSKDSQLVANCNDFPLFGRKALAEVKQNGQFFPAVAVSGVK